MHWADVVAKELLEKRQDHVLATAITPSGPIHVGNMREVLTSEAVHRAILDGGGASEFIYIADSYDPLRKVYPFLDAEKYTPYVGHPLAEIPCPCATMGDPAGGHAHYAEHYLHPFLAALDELGIRPTLLDAYRMYNDGRYNEQILAALDATAEIRTIIETVSKRQLPKAWIPFSAQCQDCGSLQTRATDYARPLVTYVCDSCKGSGQVDVTKPRSGKLPWRVDWPARWDFLGVTFEAAGKDHHAAGGSWDTGIRIAKEVFGIEPPRGMVYEFIQLKGKGAMHSSTGTGVSATDMLHITPPEVLRFLILRGDPKKHIDFDPGLGILQLVEEYDRFERVAYGKEEASLGIKDADRVYALSQPERVRDNMPIQVPYRHMVTVVQMVDDDEELLKVLKRSGELPDDLPEADRLHLLDRAAHVRAWLERFAPQDVRFRVQKERLPDIAIEQGEPALYGSLAAALDGIEWRADLIHNAIHDTLTLEGRKAGEGFRAVYLAILGKERGPRAGHFLASLDRDFVLERFRGLAATAKGGPAPKEAS